MSPPGTLGAGRVAGKLPVPSTGSPPDALRFVSLSSFLASHHAESSCQASREPCPLPVPPACSVPARGGQEVGFCRDKMKLLPPEKTLAKLWLR